jgi:hypothetical protein
MKPLAHAMFSFVVDEYGPEEAVRRLSDPYWFQALSCTLGYDWHSSGTTTVVCGVLKTVINPEEFGFAVVGGKGARSRKTPDEIRKISAKLDLPADSLIHASRMSAKVDSAALQDGYELYHHSFILSGKKWAVIQQGMNPRVKQARRYQWFCDISSFVDEPHSGITCDVTHNKVLNLTAKESEDVRKISRDLVCESVERIKRMHAVIRREPSQRSLAEWIVLEEEKVETFSLPWRMNWDALRRAWEYQPSSYEELLSIPGIGKSTLRALALISDLIYGKKPSWKDPAKYSFAFGGKDGVPYPVNRKRMKDATDFLYTALQEAKLGKREKMDAIRRLREFC